MNSFGGLIENLPVRKRRQVRRWWALGGPIFLLCAVLFGRGFYLQIMRGATYRSQAENNRVTPQVLAAPRGIFYDATGKQLVENIASTDVIIDPAKLPPAADRAQLMASLQKFLPDTPADTIQHVIEQAQTSRRPTLLVKALDHDSVLALQQATAQLPGVRLASSLVRKYLFPQSLAHILGYTSAVTPGQLAKDDQLLPTDTTGKAGLEAQYNTLLRGTHGTSYVEVNAAGKPQVDLGEQDPVSGQDLYLTVNSDLQNYTYSLFYDRDQANQKAGKPKVAGAAVIMDPQTGAIQALVTYPSYDPNIFSQPALRNQATALFTDEAKPMFNRAIDGTYASGSIIKPFEAAGGLQEGIITDKSTVLSTGGIQIGPYHFFDWKAGGHGVTDVKKAIAESVNTFFYLLAGGDATHTGLGPDKIAYYLGLFGWAKPTGIDLPQEASGFVPTPAWKEATFHDRWYVGDTYHLGIGQGNVLVTPLQIATATSALANGKYLYRPYLLQSDHVKKQVVPIDAKNMQIVREGMRQAVTDGSARQLNTLDIPIAGKTGTAQIGGSEDTQAWFTSFGPFDKPQLTVTVLLEKGGAGDADAEPIAKDIWQWWITNGQKKTQ